MADKSVELGLASDSAAVLRKYQAREREGSTGMENGIAIPHAQDDSIPNAAMLLVTLKKPIEWETLDNSKVDHVISFLIPEKGSEDHLKYLSNTAKLLTHSEFVSSFTSATNVDELYNLFK